MSEIQSTPTQRKLKVSLEDYDYKRDISGREFLSQILTGDLEIFEEILLGSIKRPLQSLSADLGMSLPELTEALERLLPSQLFKIEADALILDKERRKYYELNIERLNDNFAPDLEFVRGLLKQVPIHSLPIWYFLPRNVSDIFESLVEKYFLTPAVYERHLTAAPLENPLLSEVAKRLLNSPNFKLEARALCKDFGLSSEAFHKLCLELELNFIGFLTFEEKEASFIPKLTLLKEYTDYLKKKQTLLPKSSDPLPIEELRPVEFAFVKDMSKIVQLAKSHGLELNTDGNLTKESVQIISRSLEKMPELTPSSLDEQAAYFNRLVKRLTTLDVLAIKDGELVGGSSEARWNELSLDDQGFCLLSRLREARAQACGFQEKSAREAEKATAQAIGHSWISFEAFMEGAIIPLRPEIDVRITRQGRRWHYALPSYTEAELALMKKTLFEGLFEAGIVALGTHRETKKTYFKVTPFGEAMFGQ